MTAEQPQAGQAGQPQAGQARRRWRERRSIREIKRMTADVGDYSVEWDNRENERSRLPRTESLQLAGLVLAEAFTPSTASALIKALGVLPAEDERRREEWLTNLLQSRRGGSISWRSLGVVYRPGKFHMAPDGYADASIPEGVEAIFLYASCELPSLTTIIATVVLAEDAGDLSTILRGDYRRERRNVRVRVDGPFSALRAMLPWSRPRSYRASAVVT